MTALHWAVDRGNVSAVEALLKFGADVNAESKFDKTPLEIASDNARPDIYEMLQNAEQFRFAKYLLLVFLGANDILMELFGYRFMHFAKCAYYG